MVPPSAVFELVNNLDSGEIALAVLGFGALETELYAAERLKVGGCLGNVALVVLCPLIADFVEDDTAVIVFVGMLSEHDNGEGFIFDGGDVKLDDSEGLTCDVLCGELGTTVHKVRERGDGLSGGFEIDGHFNYSF